MTSEAKFTPKAEIFLEMAIEDYHDLGNIKKHGKNAVIGKSMLSEMDCPRKFKAKYLDGLLEPESDTLNIGNAVHSLALEPALFHDRFYVLPETYEDGKKVIRNKSHKAYQGLIEQAGKRKIITSGDFADVQGMAKAVAESPVAMALLEGTGKIEASIFWQDEETGINLRCRPDFMRDDGLLVNLKTGHSAQPDKFFRTAWDCHYDMSAAMESEGYMKLTGKAPDNYVFLVVEKNAPAYIVEAFDSFRACDVTDPQQMTYYDAGLMRFRSMLHKYQHCMKTNHWPGYVGKVTPMKVPGYALKKMEEEL